MSLAQPETVSRADGASVMLRSAANAQYSHSPLPVTERFGLRYNPDKDISARFDVAQVLDGYTLKNLPNETRQAEGSFRRHLGVAGGF